MHGLPPLFNSSPLSVALALVLGLILGSFIAALTWRWPRGTSILKGRSHCDTCQTPLKPLNLIPVLSFLYQNGRCTTCAAPISRRHLGIELAAGLIAALSLFVAPGLPGLALASFGLLLLTLAVLDVEHFWLPNRLTLPLLALGLALAPPPLPDRLWGALAGYASLTLIAFTYKKLRRREGMGGGDPKLFAAIGAWLGWTQLPFVLLGAGLIGLLLVLLDKQRGAPLKPDTPLPLGSLLALAAWPLALLQFGS